MNGDNCAKHVATALQSVAEVKSAQVDLQAGTATVVSDSALNVSTEAAAVDAAGYKPEPIARQDAKARTAFFWLASLTDRRRQMDSYFENTNRCDIRLDSEIDGETTDRVRAVLASIPGAELADVEGSILSIDFYPEVASESLIAGSLESAGLRLGTEPKEGFLAQKLAKMGERNRKTFGTGPLDCCDLPEK